MGTATMHVKGLGEKRQKQDDEENDDEKDGEHGPSDGAATVATLADQMGAADGTAGVHRPISTNHHRAHRARRRAFSISPESRATTAAREKERKNSRAFVIGASID
jgi:hypothetical protein